MLERQLGRNYIDVESNMQLLTSGEKFHCVIVTSTSKRLRLRRLQDWTLGEMKFIQLYNIKSSFSLKRHTGFEVRGLLKYLRVVLNFCFQCYPSTF